MHFVKVVLPDIMPGIFSGFLLAFTMSLDDFVITHFTKGPGVDTLSTKIYSEVRKGIKPEMYALSTLMFVTVLMLTDPDQYSAPARKNAKQNVPVRFGRARRIGRCLLPEADSGSNGSSDRDSAGLSTDKKTEPSKNGQVIVYNWGEYIDPEIIDLFEEETGIDVIYEEFETNEIMYPKIQSGAIAYDVVCPSDYMIQRMIENDLLAEINYDHIPNLKYIGDNYMKMSRQFDPENKYSVPYLWGTVGILYNKKMVDEPVDSWGILWDKKYEDSILMQDSVRDAFAVALKYLGYSLNSTDLDELEAAKESAD